MSSSENQHDRFRVIGVVGATGVIVAATVGSGIFSLTGTFGASVGTPRNLIAPWIIGGIIALCGGLSLAELGAMIPCSGGSIEFARRAFGATIGYLVAIVTLLAGYILSITVIALFFAGFIDALVPTGLPDSAEAAIAIAIAFGSQIAGLHAGFKFNTALSILKVAFVGLFVVAGLLVSDNARIALPSSVDPSVDPGLFSPAVASATLAVSFAYLGWSSGADIAGEIKNPGRNIPRAMLSAIAIIFVLYIGVNLVYLRAIDPAAMLEPDGKPMKAIGAVAAEVLFGKSVGSVIAIAIAILLFSTLVPSMIGAARIIESMASSREIPAWMGIRLANGVPLRGLVVAALASIAALAIGSLNDILEMLTVLVNVFSALSVGAIFVLRRTMPDAPRPFRVPFYPVTPILYLGLAAWSIVVGVMASGLRGLIASAIAVAVLLLIRPLLTFDRR